MLPGHLLQDRSNLFFRVVCSNRIRHALRTDPASLKKRDNREQVKQSGNSQVAPHADPQLIAFRAIHASLLCFAARSRPLPARWARARLKARARHRPRLLFLRRRSRPVGGPARRRRPPRGPLFPPPLAPPPIEIHPRVVGRPCKSRCPPATQEQ